jgi:hypothetical protein
MHMITHPLTLRKEVVILFATIRKQIFGQIGIQTGRAIFSPLGIRKWTNFRQSFVVPTSISPKATDIAKVNQFLNLLSSIKVFLKFYTIELRITIKMAVDGKNATIRKFVTDTGTGAHWGAFVDYLVSIRHPQGHWTAVVPVLQLHIAWWQFQRNVR